MAAAPATVEEIKKAVSDTMKLQQVQLLTLAANNAQKLIADQAKKSATGILDSIDGEITKAREHDGHEWKNKINRSNFDALRDIELMWERAERFVSVLNVEGDQADLKAGAVKYIEQGKNLTKQRLKVLRIADRDGWAAALCFVADDIADDEKEEQRMKRGRKEAQQKKAHAEKSSRDRSPHDRRGGSSYERQYQERRRGFGGEGYGRSVERRICYTCNREGLISRARPRNITPRGGR